jgi:hypothetical protein
MRVQYYIDENEPIWQMQTVGQQSLPNLGDNIVIQGVEYRLLFRRWYLAEYVQPALGQSAILPEIMVDIRVERVK